MKIFFSLFFLLAVVLAVYPFFNQSENRETLTGLPWQIEVLGDGATQVFGITIGKSRLSDAIAVLGSDMELAVIAAQDETGKLEMYYGYYKAGLLSGKLILQTSAADREIQRWRDNAVSSEYMATGKAKKFMLSDIDRTEVLTQTIISVTFVPAVNLDESVIVARFGEPELRLEKSGVSHFLYPQQGLHIALYENAKEVLQYVKPADFQQLVAPLEK